MEEQFEELQVSIKLNLYLREPVHPAEMLDGVKELFIMIFCADSFGAVGNQENNGSDEVIERFYEFMKRYGL